MPLIFPLPLYREKKALLRIVALGSLCLVLSTGCSKAYPFHGEQRPNPYFTSDTRHPIPLSSPAGKEHRAVMLQHLESIQVIVNALVEEDYELAKGLTESHLGFFMHRQAMAQQQPERDHVQKCKRLHSPTQTFIGKRLTCHHLYRGRQVLLGRGTLGVLCIVLSAVQ